MKLQKLAILQTATKLHHPIYIRVVGPTTEEVAHPFIRTRMRANDSDILTSQECDTVDDKALRHVPQEIDHISTKRACFIRL